MRVLPAVRVREVERVEDDQGDEDARAVGVRTGGQSGVREVGRGGNVPGEIQARRRGEPGRVSEGVDPCARYAALNNGIGECTRKASILNDVRCSRR